VRDERKKDVLPVKLRLFVRGQNTGKCVILIKCSRQYIRCVVLVPTIVIDSQKMMSERCEYYGSVSHESHEEKRCNHAHGGTHTAHPDTRASQFYVSCHEQFPLNLVPNAGTAQESSISTFLAYFFIIEWHVCASMFYRRPGGGIKSRKEQLWEQFIQPSFLLLLHTVCSSSRRRRQ